MLTRIRIAVCLFFVVAFSFLSGAAQAKYMGGLPVCTECEASCPRSRSCAPTDKASNTSTSLSEGNLLETYAGPAIAGGSGAALSLDLSFNSNLADGSNGRVNTVLGVGWTHNFNVFLFRQRSEMFRSAGNGRVNKFSPVSSTSYRSTEGYFSILNRTATGFTLRYKGGASETFAMIPGSSTLNGQPVYWLQQMTDRLGNVTTLNYSGGLLASITNAYGRSLTLTYSTARKLVSITDPLGRTTTVQYDSSNARVMRIVDPTGKAVQYTYNALYQITRKLDKDGRSFTFGYQVDKPVSVTDGAGASLLTQTNTSNWATDSTTLGTQLMRLYIPSTTSRTDGNGQIWQYDYDASGYITGVRAPDGAVTRYTYDPATLNVATVTDANNRTTSYQYDSQGNLTRETNPLGHVTTYTYEPVFNQMTSMTDANGRVTTYDIDPANGNRLKETDPLGGTRVWTYDSHGNVLTETDKNGNVSQHGYDAFGNRIQTTDAVGKPEERTTTYTYDAVGNRTTRTDDNSHTTRYAYDALNRLVKETDPAGKITGYAYDGQGNRVQVTDRNGNITRFQFDLRQRLVKTTDALNQSTTQTYDGNGNRVSLTDKNGHATTFQYDTQNRLVKTTDAETNVSSMQYDPVGNVLTQTDANGHATKYTYDALNRRMSSLDAENNLTRYAYDSVGTPVCAECTGPTRGSSLITQQSDANGKFTYFKYDGLDRLSRQVRKQTDIANTIDADDAVTRYSYDAHGNRLTLTEPNGNTMSTTYDGLHRTTRETNAAGDTTRYQYDGVNNVTRVIAPNGNQTTSTYDVLDRVTEVNDNEGLVARYSYDFEGNRLSQCDGNLNCTTRVYDAIYRVVQTIDALGQPTKHAYDPVGNLTQTTDREGNVTTYAYDDINRRIRSTDAQPFVTEYDYDGVGNLKAIRAFNDTEDAVDPPQITTYTYDAINRLVKETYPDAGVRSFTYDGVSNLVTRTDQKGQITRYHYSDLYYLTKRDYPDSGDDVMRYDLSGRMLSACREGAPDNVADTCTGWLVTFAYDAANRVTATAQNGKIVTYVYDIPNRLRGLTYPGGKAITETTDFRSRLDKIDDASSPPPIVQYSYDPGNRVLTRVYRNGSTASYSYNANNWITGLEHRKADTSLIAGFGHAYDNEGNKVYERKTHDAARSEAYQYDDVYRLVDYKVGALVGSTVPVPATQTQYDLDKVGNWKTKTQDGAPEDRDHNAVNEITAIAGVPVLSDDNGNTREDARYTYAYDEENRLTAVTRKADAKLVGQYQYDALSRRVMKIANPFGTTSETRYFYDDARIIEEQNASTSTLATYVYGNYIDEVLSMDRGGQTVYYHQNSLWSVAAITNSATTVVERYSYDAYGFPTITDAVGNQVPVFDIDRPRSAIGNPWMFTGRQLDEETGIYFYRARYYDPIKGRFLQRDPSGYVDGMNLYEYVRNNPTNRTDPSGNFAFALYYLGKAVAGHVVNKTNIWNQNKVEIPWGSIDDEISRNSRFEAKGDRDQRTGPLCVTKNLTWDKGGKWCGMLFGFFGFEYKVIFKWTTNGCDVLGGTIELPAQADDTGAIQVTGMSVADAGTNPGKCGCCKFAACVRVTVTVQSHCWSALWPSRHFNDPYSGTMCGDGTTKG